MTLKKDITDYFWSVLLGNRVALLHIPISQTLKVVFMQSSSMSQCPSPTEQGNFGEQRFSQQSSVESQKLPPPEVRESKLRQLSFPQTRPAPRQPWSLSQSPPPISQTLLTLQQASLPLHLYGKIWSSANDIRTSYNFGWDLLGSELNISEYWIYQKWLLSM